MNALAAEPWIVGPRASQPPRVRLLCLAHAGGSATQYMRWGAALPSTVELVPVELPGHLARLHEAPYTSLVQCAGDMAAALAPLTGLPYLLFGYSMGGVLAFELCRALRARESALPRALYVAASPAPDVPRATTTVYLLDDAAFLRAMQHTYRGIPDAVAADAELLQLVLPPLRCDMQMLETYTYTPQPPLECPIQPLGGADDQIATAAHLHAWLRHSAQPRPPHIFPGGHFFLEQQRNAILELMANDLTGISP